MNLFLKPWLVSLLFLVIMLAIYPQVDQFEFDEDEGINLIKGSLVAEGHSLYNEIWSDQPPLLTQVFAAGFKLGGQGVEWGRFMVLAFSVFLVWCLQRIAIVLEGTACAVISVLILATVPGFTKLSVSAMVGLPSIALAVAALSFQLAWHRNRSNLWLVISGALLAMSVMTKLFTLFLVPVFLVGIIAGSGRSIRRRSISAMYWLAGFLGVSGALATMWLEPGALGQLTAPHLEAQSVAIYQGQHWLRGFEESLALLILAGFGAVIQFRRRQWLWLYPSAWMLIGLVILLSHTPVRYHQRLLVTIPAIPLAAWVVMEAIDSLRRKPTLRELLVPALVFTLLGLAAGQHWPSLQEFLVSGDRGKPSRINRENIVHDMRGNAGQGDWVVTDRPIYAFRSGLLVAPPVAVLTGKRLRTGRIDEDMLMRAVKDYDVREILLARFEWPTLPGYLEEDFNSTTYGDLGVLFVRKRSGP